MTPSEDRIYTLVKGIIGSEIKNLKDFHDERHLENTKKFDALFTKIDGIIFDIQECPRMHKTEIDREFKSIKATNKTILFTIIGAPVIGIVAALIINFLK